MRHSLCSIDVPAQDPLQARQRTRAAAALFGLPPLPSLRWGAAVAELALAPQWQAGSATLTLWLDTTACEGAAPRLLAELLSEQTVDNEPPHLVSKDLHFRIHAPGGGAGTVITLGVDLPAQDPLPTEAQIQARCRELLALRAHALSDELAQHSRDLRDALAAFEEERLAHAQTVRRHEAALALLAHDLRSPLLTLNLSLEMLRLKPHDAAELEARRELMKRQIDQLKALAGGLLPSTGAQLHEN